MAEWSSNLNDSTRHGTNVCASVAPDLSLVPDSSNRDTLEGPQQHLGNGAGQAGLASAWRAHKAQDGGTCICPPQPPYSQVLYNTILHLSHMGTVKRQPCGNHSIYVSHRLHQPDAGSGGLNAGLAVWPCFSGGAA